MAAFGNSTGDRQMLEYTQAGGGAALEMLVLHDDAVREYAYGPAQGLPDSKVGTFPQALYDEAKSQGLDRHQHEERLEADLCRCSKVIALSHLAEFLRSHALALPTLAKFAIAMAIIVCVPRAITPSQAPGRGRPAAQRDRDRSSRTGCDRDRTGRSRISLPTWESCC